MVDVEDEVEVVESIASAGVGEEVITGSGGLLIVEGNERS